MAINISNAEIVDIVCETAKGAGYLSLEEEQQQAILNFVSGRDVFVSLPTGYGN